jgi:hypothetical protein
MFHRFSNPASVFSLADIRREFCSHFITGNRERAAHGSKSAAYRKQIGRYRLQAGIMRYTAQIGHGIGHIVR